MGNKNMNMRLMQYSIVGLSLFSYISLYAVRIINVTGDPIYFSVFFKRGGSVVRQIRPIYTAEPNGSYFVDSCEYDFSLEDPVLKITTFKWPPQKCEEFSDAEMAGIGVGVALGAATVGAAVGAGVGVVAIGEEVATPAAAAAAAGVGSAAGGLIGGVGGGAGAGTMELCKSHYPRTVLFSYDKADIERMKYDMKKLQNEQTASGLYLGDNIDGGETHFLFYNAYGFDPRYAVYGKPEGHGAIKAGRINSQAYDNKPLIPRALCYYLRFAHYLTYGG